MYRPSINHDVRRGRTLLAFRMRNILCGLIVALASPVLAQTAPVAERVAKQNALFDEFWETGLKN